MSSQPQTANTSSLPGFVTPTGEDRLGRSIYVVGDRLWVKIRSRDTNGAFTTMEGTTEPGGGPPLHVHFEQDEWWYVLEGQFVFEVDGKRLTAGPGDTVFAPRGSRHTFQNVGATVGKVVVTAIPGGLDEFFEELEKLVPEGAVPDPAVILPLFHKYSMDLVGPPLRLESEEAA